MKSRSGIGLTVLVVGIASAGGCTDSPEIVQVAPPGMEYRRVPPPTAGSGAEALGEQPSASAKAAPMVSTIISEPTKVGETKKTNSGLVYATLKEGTGPAAQPGQSLKVKYVGRLTDGTKFDSNDNFALKIGVGGVIKGWDEGIPGMKVGERRQLVIPSDMAYGSRPSGPIPANSNLVFEVELLDAK